MKAYIRSKELGRFIGAFIGLGLFEFHIQDGQCSPEERPIEFESEVEAQRYLDSWTGGKADCYVEVVP